MLCMFAAMKKRSWRRNTTGRWTLEQIRAVVEINKAGCWVWTGAIGVKNGYGYVRTDGKTTTTHRVTYVEAKGPIPEGLEIDHLCRNRACCNPDHLEAVTTGINSYRGESLAGINARKTHCINGHELPPFIAGGQGKRGRRCKECERAYRSSEQWLAHRRAYRKRKAIESGLVVIKDAAYYTSMAKRRKEYQDQYREANREKIRAYHRDRKRQIRLERLAMEQRAHQG